MTSLLSWLLRKTGGKEVRIVIKDQLPISPYSNCRGGTINNKTIVDEVHFGKSVLCLDGCRWQGGVVLINHHLIAVDVRFTLLDNLALVADSDRDPFTTIH